MKRNVIFLLMFVVLGFVSCKDDDPEPDKAAPTVEWPENSEFAPVEIEKDMTGKAVIVVKAEAGIKDFKLAITSDVLTNEALGMIGLSSTMDLINDENVVGVLGEFNIPVGNKLKDATSVNFDVSALVPMILTLNPANSGDHIFTLNITDNQGKNIQKALTFHNTIPSTFAVSDVNLWTNSALVSVEHLAENAKVQYRLEGEENWIDLEKNADGKFAIKPVWNEDKNEAGLTVYNVDSKSGIFAGHNYEFRATLDDKELGTGSYKANDGDAIPNGDMAVWNEKTMTFYTTTKQVPYPNLDNQNFWDSGNNVFAILCSHGEGEDAGTASLKATNVLGAIFAAGNMFTGTFEQPGLTGSAKFGVAYTYTARPVAIKLRYKVKVGICDAAGDLDPKKDEYLDKKIDQARIFAAIVDWTGQHSVTSGMTDEAPNVWDPAIQNSTGEGNILAYASTYLGENADTWTELILPISWYQKEAAMPTNEYSLVISCATSARGDYLTGCSTNELYVDDFEWVY